ncbi:MAG: hypothetical protein ACR5K4_01625 [Sodalis sp. (in: enterobacteria)]
MVDYPDQNIMTELVIGHYTDPFSLLGMDQTATVLVVRILLLII